MLENPMTAFILAASFFGIRAIQKPPQSLIYASLSGLMLFLAFMIKGVPGLFPLAIFFLYWFFNKKEFRFKQMLIYTGLAALTFGFCFGLLFLFEESRSSMTFYLEARLFKRIGDNPTVDSRFYIVSDFLQNLIIPLILSAFALWQMRRKELKQTNLKAALFLFSLGLAGILPIMLTKVQRGFYISPAYPFIALALAIIMLPAIQDIRERVSEKQESFFRVIGLVTFISVISLSILLAGTPKRDKELLEDVYKIGNSIGNGHLITCSLNFMTKDWGPKSYFMRYFEMEIDAWRTEYPPEREQRSALYKKGEKIPEGLVPFDLELNLYRLYTIKEGSPLKRGLE